MFCQLPDTPGWNLAFRHYHLLQSRIFEENRPFPGQILMEVRHDSRPEHDRSGGYQADPQGRRVVSDQYYTQSD